MYSDSDDSDSDSYVTSAHPCTTPATIVPAKLIFSSSMDQRFPSDVYKYMKQNVPPSMILKLMQICKYFQYYKFPYLVYRHGLYVLLDKKIRFYNKWKYKYDYTWHIHPYSRIKEMELTKLPNNNLWINKIFVCERDPDLVPLIIPKVAFFDIKLLVLEKQNITINEFKILTAAGKIVEIYFTSVFIENKDGNMIFFENLLKCLPKVEKISIKNAIPSIRSLDALAKVCSPKLQCLKFEGIPETCFNISNMVKFMHWHFSEVEKNPKNENIVFDFTFNDYPSLVFIDALQIAVDELTESWKYKSGHFHFIFKNCNEKSKKIMVEFCDKYDPYSCERWRRICGCKINDYCECGLWNRSRTQSEDDYDSKQDPSDYYDEWEMKKAEKAAERNKTKKFVAKKKESKLRKNQNLKTSTQLLSRKQAASRK